MRRSNDVCFDGTEGSDGSPWAPWGPDRQRPDGQSFELNRDLGYDSRDPRPPIYGDSPIERQLFYSLQKHIHSRGEFRLLLAESDGHYQCLLRDVTNHRPSVIIVRPQFEIDRLEARSVYARGLHRLGPQAGGLAASDRRMRRLQATDEQVARDQKRDHSAQELGIDVMRIPGLEIMTDWLGCVERVMGWVTGSTV